MIRSIFSKDHCLEDESDFLLHHFLASRHAYEYHCSIIFLNHSQLA
jgi:hypothetical protein